MVRQMPEAQTEARLVESSLNGDEFGLAITTDGNRTVRPMAFAATVVIGFKIYEKRLHLFP